MKGVVNNWVLLRGLTREHRHWEHFPAMLQHVFPDSKVHAIDLPGNGRYFNLKSPRRVEPMLEHVREQVKALDIKQPVHIIGLSMGAMVAMQWMVSYPQECAAAILMNPSFRGISPFYQRLRPRNYLRILYALTTGNLVSRENIIFKLTSNLVNEPDDLLRRWVSYAQENPVSTKNAMCQLLAASGYELPAEKPDVPILLLRGLIDKLVNANCSLALAQAWNLTLHTHPTAGHDLTLDDELWVGEKIQDWLIQQ